MSTDASDALPQTPIRENPSLRELFRIYETQIEQRFDRATAARYTAEGRDIPLWATESAAAEQVSTLDALQAGDRIAKLLNGWRWQLMRQAREEGRSWSEIGAALDMTKQGAFDYYRKRRRPAGAVRTPVLRHRRRPQGSGRPGKLRAWRCRTPAAGMRTMSPARPRPRDPTTQAAGWPAACR